MAITTGSDYEHIDILKGNNTTRHYLKDSTAREQIDALPVKSGTGNYSTVEGQLTTASGAASHAEGQLTTASGRISHVEGYNNTASGESSHAEGADTVASGYCSHAEGSCTIAKGANQHVGGIFNVADTNTNPLMKGNYIEIMGNGADENNRSNARTLDWAGNEALAGSLTLGKGTANETTITAAQLKQLIAMLS